MWPEHARVFTSWYETLRDARTALDVDDVDAQVARQLVKDIYVRTIGMMGSHELHVGKRGYAPDRRHAIVAKARSNLLRRVHQIGTDTNRWPVAINNDSVAYVSTTRTRSAPGRASRSTSAGALASTRPSAAACSPRTCHTSPGVAGRARAS